MTDFAGMRIVPDKYLADDARPIPFQFVNGRMTLSWSQPLTRIDGYLVSEKLYDVLKEKYGKEPVAEADRSGS